jgi:DNA polymerase-4
MAILADFSPALQPMGLDEAYLDATGFESLHCTIREMAVKIKNRIRSELGICASIGIAGCRVAAKVASGVSKPDGLIDIPEGGERAFLAPLPITRLPGIGKKTEEVVKSLGVQTISDLQTYPPGALKMRFGSYAEALQRRANGIDESPVEAHGISKSISHETTFNEDTRDRSILEATIRYLCEKVGASLRSQHRQAHCISLKLRYSDFTTITRQITLKQSDDTDQALYTAVHQLLEKELMKARQAVRLLGVAVSSLTEPSRQLELMNPQTQRLENLNRAIDRIRNKYGFSSIQTGQTMLLKDLYKQKSTQ